MFIRFECERSGETAVNSSSTHMFVYIFSIWIQAAPAADTTYHAYAEDFSKGLADLTICNARKHLRYV